MPRATQGVKCYGTTSIFFEFVRYEDQGSISARNLPANLALSCKWNLYVVHCSNTEIPGLTPPALTGPRVLNANETF